MNEDSTLREPDLSLHRSTRALSITDLCYFVALAEESHMAKAAERVGAKQSDLSKAITKMETRLGRQLFVRTTKSTQLALAGEELLPRARKILVQLDDAYTEVRGKEADRDTFIEVNIYEETAGSRLTKILNRVRAEKPEMRFRVCRKWKHIRLPPTGDG